MMLKIHIRKAILTLFLIVLSLKLTSQHIIRFSDGQPIDSLFIVNKDGSRLLTKSQLKIFDFRNNDKILYKNKLIDFSVSNDTLFLFDKVSEIEGIEFSALSGRNKKQKIIKNSRNKRHSADLPNDILVATHVPTNFQSIFFVKSITLFPKFIESTQGTLEIQILHANTDGLPDIQNPILIFEKSLSEITQNKWEIKLPKIVKLRNEDFYIAFKHKGGSKRNVSFLLNHNSQMLMYYPQLNEWKEFSINGYHYKLRILR